MRGYPGQTFEGHIERIAPAADPVTRQVTIFVDVPNTRGRLVAGLFAEGRVTSERRQTLVVPATAVDTGGQSPWVLRLRDGRAERVTVQVGVRDDRTERVEILAGIAAGDVLLIGAARAVTPGTPVTVSGRQPGRSGRRHATPCSSPISPFASRSSPSSRCWRWWCSGWRRSCC